MAWTREGSDYFNQNGLRISKVPTTGGIKRASNEMWAVFDLDGKRITPYRKYLKDAKADGDAYDRPWTSDHWM
jgi:hypothetical protein